MSITRVRQVKLGAEFSELVLESAHTASRLSSVPEVECANKVFGAAIRAIEVAARRNERGLDGMPWAFGLVQVSEAHRSDSDGCARWSRAFQSGLRHGVDLRSAEPECIQRKSIGACVEAVCVKSHQRLIAKASVRAPAEAGIAVVRGIEREHIETVKGIRIERYRKHEMTGRKQSAGVWIHISLSYGNEEMAGAGIVENTWICDERPKRRADHAGYRINRRFRPLRKKEIERLGIARTKDQSVPLVSYTVIASLIASTTNPLPTARP